LDASDKELIWYLMPLKHIHNWTKIFQIIDKWLNGKSIVDFAVLNRFFIDTYKKAYTPENVASKLIKSVESMSYDTSICEYHPEFYNSNNQIMSTLSLVDSSCQLLKELQIYQNKEVTVSLSGGVDSMLMTALLRRLGIDVIAVHIVYGNRKESQEEYKFISTYCNKLGIPLYIYNVEWLRRNSMDRKFYEDMTRELRFSAYKALNRPVLMGHIQEDVIENIWTNLAHGTHLNNLSKFERQMLESGVTICRPWLSIKKNTIYEAANKLCIPYLKNTTPKWSNRGKFREHFYSATHEQFGSSVDIKLLEVAERFRKQADLLEKLLYQEISNSWSPITKTLNVTRALIVDLDVDGWLRIFTDLAHNKLHITKPSFKACKEFTRRVLQYKSNSKTINQVINIKKDLTIMIFSKEEQIFIQAIL
jgi:tRNA(Ile)-lysidine synthetase-like protein